MIELLIKFFLKKKLLEIILFFLVFKIEIEFSNNVDSKRRNLRKTKTQKQK